MSTTPLNAHERAFAHAEGAATSAFRNLAGAAFMVPLALALGAEPLHIGLIAAAPFVGRVVQALASGLVCSIGARAAALGAGAADRMMIAFVATLPFWLSDSVWAPWVVVLSLFVSASFGELYSVAVAVWLAERTRDAERGRFLAERTSWANGVGIVASLGAGLLIAWGTVGNVAAEGIGVALLAGAGVGLIGIGAGSRIPALPVPVRVVQPRLGEAIRMTFGDSRFRAFLRYSLVWGFAVNLASPFMMQYAVEELGFTVAHTAAIVAVHLGAGLLLLPFWGRVADRYGNRALLVGCGFWGAVVPALWLVLATPAFPWGVYLVELVSGAAWAGINLASANALVKLAPAHQRVAYVAVFTATTGLGLALAPVLGGLTITALEPLGSLRAFQVFFLLATLVRLWALFAIRSVPGIGAETLARSAAVLQRANPPWVTPAGLGTALLWVPVMAESARQHGRRTATRALRETLPQYWRRMALLRRRAA